MLSSRCRAILCAKLRALATPPPIPPPIPPTTIQPPPRANQRQMAGAGSSTGALAIGALGAVGLLNDSTRGEWMIIWDVQIVAVPNPIPSNLMIADLAISGQQVPGSLFFPSDNHPSTSGVGTVPGSMWTHNSAANELGNTFNSTSLIVSGNTAYYQWLHEWPVCALQPGDSVVAYSDGFAYFDFGAGYLYEILPGGL